MEKNLKIISINDKQSDLEYWLTKTPVERLEAIEFLRNQYILFLKDVPTRLQRVCRIINKIQSLQHKDIDDIEISEKK